jgi:hypothetical protein
MMIHYDHIPIHVKWDIQENFPQVEFKWYYGYQNQRVNYIGGQLSDHQFTLFMLKYSEFIK